VGLDATRKNKPFDGFAREWPRDLVFPEEIQARVAARWKELGL
jgi:4-hydroxy-3-polyprenylbenzoate decarboxylase